MKRVDIGNMPQTGFAAQIAWLRNAVVKLTLATRRDDAFRYFTKLNATDAYAPPSLNDGDLDTPQVVVLAGASLGNIVLAAFDQDLQGVDLKAWVSDADEVTYQFVNRSGGTVALAAGNVILRVLRFPPSNV